MAGQSQPKSGIHPFGWKPRARQRLSAGKTRICSSRTSRAVSSQVGYAFVRLDAEGQLAVECRQSDSSQQQNSSSAVSNQIEPPVRFEVQGQTAVQRRQSDSSQQQNSSRAVSNQIGHAPARMEATTTESRQVRVSDTSHLIRPTGIQNSLGLANPAAD